MHDPLARVAHREKAHTELGAIRPQGLHLGAAERVGDLQANVCGGDVVVLGGQRQVRSTHLAPGHAQPVEGLGGGDLVDEVQVDEQQVRFSVGAVY